MSEKLDGSRSNRGSRRAGRLEGRLEGKVALITGGSAGVGRGTVERFVAEGAQVVIADIQDQRGEELAQSLGENAGYVHADVSRESDVERMIALAVERYGRLDCLFNNAGYIGVTGEIDVIEIGDEYRRTIDVMLTGPILGMKHAARVMKAQGSGSIVTTASVAGLRGDFGPHVYCAVKAAVINLTRSVALELGAFGIRVNTICPGGIATEIFGGLHHLTEEQRLRVPDIVRNALGSMQAIRRSGEPSDIAAMAVFLASDDSAFVSGQAMVVDGGLTAGNVADPETSPLRMALEAEFGPLP